ncbi:uncharacterized protein [Physcomitrium patens]|uniref:uncharacterized protein isoform X3 n=1 Tax=Physcomitrium patens TaxID=3218 RepID=UPI003CCD3A22
MVNLTIRLSKAGGNSGLKAEQNLLEANEASLPSKLIGADLPHANGLGFSWSDICTVNIVGFKAQRKSGEKVHICLRCNFPIAVYGRMEQCHHVLCLACAENDSTCFLCKGKVARIQKVDVSVGIYICGVPGCLRSFVLRPDFEWHIANDHSQPSQPESTKITPNQLQVRRSEDASQSQSDLVIRRRNSSTSLQVIILKKEDSQRLSKISHQNPQVPPIRSIQSRDEHIGLSYSITGNVDSRQQQEHISWDSTQQGQKLRDIYKVEAHEGQSQRDRRSDTGPYHCLRKRERGRGPRGGHQPSSLSSSKDLPKQRERVLQAQHCQQPSTLPLPPLYPPPNHLQKIPTFRESGGCSLRLESHREFCSSLAMPPPGPPPGGWPVNLIPQDGYGTNGCPRRPPDSFGHIRPMGGMLQDRYGPQIGSPRPHFLPEFGHPRTIKPPISIPRFHEGHLPPPPPPPPRHLPQRAALIGTRPNLGESITDYGWGPGHPGNFGVPRPGQGFPGWLPPAN